MVKMPRRVAIVIGFVLFVAGACGPSGPRRLTAQETKEVANGCFIDELAVAPKVGWIGRVGYKFLLSTRPDVTPQDILSDPGDWLQTDDWRFQRQFEPDHYNLIIVTKQSGPAGSKVFLYC